MRLPVVCCRDQGTTPPRQEVSRRSRPPPLRPAEARPYNGSVTRQLTLETAGPEQTHALGVRLGRLLRPGDAVLLSGELGTGKTVLTQGIAEGLDVQEPVKSPSFVLLHQYEGRTTVYHADLYRLESPEEVADLGLDEVAAEGVLVVEWAERGGGVLPPDHLWVRLEYGDDDRRRITLAARGPRYEDLLDRLAEAAPRQTEVR